MRRRDVSPEELARIIRLRQSNTSWLQIQRDTGLPRRVAKRAYEQWGRSQAREELKAARKDVAAEEFRNHLGCLIKLAQSLVMALDIPQPSQHLITAKEVLLSLWRTDIVGEYGAYGLPEVGRQTYRPETYLRQNLMLFNSLKAHTHEKDWQALEKWEAARDACTGVLDKLQEKARKTLLNILNQKELADRIVKGSRKKDAVERMLEGTLHAIWECILAGKPDQPPLIEAISQGEGMTEVTFSERRLSERLIFTETNLGREVADTCIWAAKNLGIERKEDMIKLVNAVSAMRKAIEELREMLNPLMLGPLILRTQCDMCPA